MNLLINNKVVNLECVVYTEADVKIYLDDEELFYKVDAFTNKENIDFIISCKEVTLEYLNNSKINLKFDDKVITLDITHYPW